jgi:serine/threonine-protein kinase
MPAEVVLEVIRGKLHGQTFRFTQRTLCLIGRAENCQIRLVGDDDRSVSRHHCLLDVDPPGVRVQDFGSRNGTYLNGVKIGQRAHTCGANDPGLEHFPECDLKDGDELRVGKTAFRVRALRPPACSVCGIELPPAARESAGRVCDCCRLKGAVPPQAVCVRCGRTLEGPAQPACADSLICLACRLDPRCLVEHLLAQANAGHRALVAIQGYRLLEELGRREEGAVFLARHDHTGDRVALKVLFPRGANERRTRRRFLREAQNTMVLKHPNVVELRDAGWSNGLFFFTLEYCEGGTVACLLKRRGGRLPLDEAAPLILQVLDGLEYCHTAEVPFVPHTEGEWTPGRGLVHRDVKPANLFLAGSGASLRAKLGDCGLAKAFDTAGQSGHTLSGMLSGTPYFMPRQQVLAYKYARPEVDVWAAAASFYYMLTGQPPRDFRKGNGWMEVVLETEAVPVRQRLPSLPARVAEVLDLALVDRPAIPFQTAAGFRDALRDVL